MKKLILLLIVFSFLFAVAVSAEEINLPESGLTPDSAFYFLKSWKESIQTFFIFGAENKAKQFLHLAEVRLAEYQKMIEKRKTEIAQKTLDKYGKQLNNAIAKVEELKNKGKDIKDISDKVQKAISKHVEVLQKNLEKSPEAAAAPYDSFAKCLSDKGVKMYGASWCSHCTNQKNMFGTSWKYVDYIECAASQGGQASACQQAGITGYPTWVFQNNQKIPGELTFEAISQYSGCK